MPDRRAGDTERPRCQAETYQTTVSILTGMYTYATVLVKRKLSRGLNETVHIPE